MFDFGANYQITVTDISTYKFHKEGILPSFYYYFFQNTKEESKFIFTTNLKPISEFNLGYYVYTYPTFGLFTIPMAYLFFLGFFKKNMKYIIMQALTLLIVCILVLLDFTLAGVHIRYLMDIYPIMIMMTFVSILIFDEKFKGTAKIIYLIVVCLIVACSSFYVIEAFLSERIRYNNF